MKLGAPDRTGRRSPEPFPGKEFKMNCSSVLLAVGRGPDSFLQKKAGIKTGKKNSIAIDDQYTDVELNQNKKEYHSYLPGGD